MNGFLRPLLFAPCLLWLVSCARIESAPEPELNAWPQTFNNTAPSVNQRWWQDFNDAELNRWVELGLERNFNLQAAWAQLAQSQALWQRNSSAQYPDLSLSLTRSREWRDSVTADLWAAGISTSYELDFWGRVAAVNEQGRLNALASLSNTRLQSNTVVASVTLNWYGLRTQATQLQLLAQQRARIESSLKVIRGRFNYGAAAITDMWQQEQVLETLVADEINARAELDRYRQQFGLWVAQPELLATDAELTVSASLPNLTAVPGVDLEALKQRPDVQQAWFKLQAANAGVAAAVADRYPRLTLTASYKGQDPDFSRLFDNWIGNLAGSLVLPLIDGANRRAAVAQQRAVVEEALANYQQVLLTAVQEVQSALTSEAQMQQRLENLERQLVLARSTEAFQNNSYRKGSGDFLSLLTAERAVLTLEQQLLNARWQQLQYRIQLYRAVSHGDFTEKEATNEPA